MMLLSPTLLYKPKRIISLVPSQTELLHHLGLEDETIGITRFCVHPDKWFNTKTRVGGTKSLYLDKIRFLQPDLILANIEENVKEQVEELALDFPVLVTDVNTLEDALSMIVDLGQLTQKSHEANTISIKIKEDFEKLTLSNQAIPTCYLIWQKPLMTIGSNTFINNMMQYAGFDNVFKNQLRYPVINIDDIKNSGCKILILSSEPYPFTTKHVEELQALIPGIKIILANGEMFSWYGSRLLQAPGYFKEVRKFLNE